MRPNPRDSRNNPLKDALRAAGITYAEVAKLAGVSWRMVMFVLDGQRTSRPVLEAIEHLASQAPRDVEGLVVALILRWQERYGRLMRPQEHRWLRANLAAGLSYLGVPEVWRRVKEKPELLDRLVRPPIGEIVQAIDRAFKRAAQGRQAVRPRRRPQLPGARRVSLARAPKRARA